jgi:hypothetical protein
MPGYATPRRFSVAENSRPAFSFAAKFTKIERLQICEICDTVPDVAGNPDSDFETIEMRNALRAAARLPLLDVATEAARPAKAREEADFEQEFARRRPDFCHQWTDNPDGWMTNMGRWSRARQQVRGEMQQS